MQDKIDTTIVIVNWNGQHLLGDCLQSLEKQTYQNFKIILVDNGSTDDSVSHTRENFPKVKIIELTENTGFAKGNNIGISKALEDANVQNVILLNNDTKVETNFLEKLLDKVDDKTEQEEKQQGRNKTMVNLPSHPRRTKQSDQQAGKIGALAPKILLWNVSSSPESNHQVGRDRIIDAVGARISLDGRGYNIGHGEIDNRQHDKSQEVFGFCGGAVLFRREMLEDVAETRSLQSCRDRVSAKKTSSVPLHPAFAGLRKGGRYKEYFDDNFFAYYEDADLSCRMRLHGWKIITVPSAVVYHLHSATADTIKSKTFKAYYLNRNRFLTMFKNFPRKLLWKGLLRVPKSYLKFTDGKSGQKNIKKNNKQGKVISMIKNKIIMTGVMTKVIGNLLLNLPKIIYQRRQIQNSISVKKNNFIKWFVKE